MTKPTSGCLRQSDKRIPRPLTLYPLTRFPSAGHHLEAYNMEIGLLINFGAKNLQFKRVHDNNLIVSSDNPNISPGNPYIKKRDADHVS